MVAIALAMTALMGAGFDDTLPSNNSGKDKDAAHSGKAPEYNYRFGNSPFLPSQAQSAGNTFLAPESFPKASYCARCHADTHQQWRQSAHANSFRAPFYKNNIDVLIAQEGALYAEHKDDPGAALLALDFRYRNPMVAHENEPYHLHDGRPLAKK